MLPGVQYDTANTASSLGKRRGRRDTSAAASITGKKSDVGRRPHVRTRPGLDQFREFLEDRAVLLDVELFGE